MTMLDAKDFNYNFYFFILEDAFRRLLLSYENILTTKKFVWKDISSKGENFIRNQVLSKAKEINRGQYVEYFFNKEHVSNINTDNRIDITMSNQACLQYDDAGYSISIECKIMNNTDTKTTAYVTEGICRFITNKYSDRLPIAGMMGFVIKDDIVTIVTTINNKLDKKTTIQALTPTTCEVFETYYPYYYQSAHKREDGNTPIDIYHVMLDFKPIII